MKSVRIERINAEIQKALNLILANELRDPQIDAIVSVTEVHTTPDLADARVYISSIGNTPPDEVFNRIKGAGGFLRGQLSKHVKLRITPRLNFYRDNSETYSAKIESILKGITYSTPADEEGENDNK